MLLVVCPATDWCFCLLLRFMECQAAESVVFEEKLFACSMFMTLLHEHPYYPFQTHAAQTHSCHSLCNVLTLDSAMKQTKTRKQLMKPQ